MGTLIVMDYTGDTRHAFDLKDATAIAEAEAKFKELTGVGFTAYTREPDPSGLTTGKLARTFDPNADTVMVPRYQGG